MSDTITVNVTKYANRKYWLMYYDDPLSGKRQWKSSRKTAKRDAERAAAKWEAELQSGRYQKATNIAWEEFRRRYEDEYVTELADSSDRMISTVFNALEKTCNPQKLRELTESRLSYFKTELRKSRSDATVRTYLAHLIAALGWANKMKLLPAVPTLEMPKRSKGSKVMKGRPITTEEFERMLAKVEVGLIAVGEKTPKIRKRKFSDAAIAKYRESQAASAAAVAESWRQLLTGLWLSGLRLGEALELYWDRPDKLRVDLVGRRPMFIIRAELEKGNQDRVLPMTPDFAEFLQTIPDAERTGPVFRPTGIRGEECREVEWVSRIICRIGKVSGVKVNTDSKGKVKTASAHDLRRSFGARWAVRVMPAVLQQLMRHESIDTTMKYYVGQNAEATADAVWEAAERINTSVNTCSPSSIGSASKKPQALTDSRLSECSLMDSNHQPSD